MFQQAKQQGKPHRDGWCSLSAPAASALKASSPQPVQFLLGLIAPAVSPPHLCFHADRLSSWADESHFWQHYSVVRHPPCPTVPGTMLPYHHREVGTTSLQKITSLPDALAPFVQHKLSVIQFWTTCGPWRKWGEGTASWWGYKILKTRAVPERQRCHRCASQHWYYASCSCYCHNMREHVSAEHSRAFWFLPLHGKGAKGSGERAFRSLQEVLQQVSAKPQENTLYSMYICTVGITLIYLTSTAQMSNWINTNP